MKKEQIMDFTRRISQSNRGGLVIVIYDIFFAYMKIQKRHMITENGKIIRQHCGMPQKLSVN